MQDICNKIFYWHVIWWTYAWLTYSSNVTRVQILSICRIKWSFSNVTLMEALYNGPILFYALWRLQWECLQWHKCYIFVKCWIKCSLWGLLLSSSLGSVTSDVIAIIINLMLSSLSLFVIVIEDAFISICREMILPNLF